MSSKQRRSYRADQGTRKTEWRVSAQRPAGEWLARSPDRPLAPLAHAPMRAHLPLGMWGESEVVALR